MSSGPCGDTRRSGNVFRVRWRSCSVGLQCREQSSQQTQVRHCGHWLAMSIATTRKRHRCIERVLPTAHALAMTSRRSSDHGGQLLPSTRFRFADQMTTYKPFILHVHTDCQPIGTIHHHVQITSKTTCIIFLFVQDIFPRIDMRNEPWRWSRRMFPQMVTSVDGSFQHSNQCSLMGHL